VKFGECICCLVYACFVFYFLVTSFFGYNGFKCIWRSYYIAQFYLQQEANILKNELLASFASHFSPP
jgi:hypothetical protein